MPKTETVDEVVPRGNSGPAVRQTFSETVNTDGSKALKQATGVDDRVTEGGRRERTFKPSTQKLFEDLDKPGATSSTADPDDAGLVEETADTATDTDDVVEDGAAKTDAVKETQSAPNEWQTKAERLEASNRKLIEDYETSQKRTDDMPARIKALDEADRAYVDEGTVSAIRKFIATVIDAKPDSKEVDAELSGLYADLTARELNVPLEQAHQASRDAARTRLALARDRRERKAESDATANRATQDTDTRQTEQAATFIGNKLTTKRESGKSFADDHPMLMSLAEDLDGMKPEKLIWKTIQHETKIGTLDPLSGDDAMIAAAARKIETYYQGLADKVSKAKPVKTTDTTKSGDKQTATADTTSKDQRQSHGARTITNASASVAPATSPKTKQPTQTEKPKFKTDKERREFLLNKYFPDR